MIANGHLNAISLLVNREAGVGNAYQSPNGQRALHAAGANEQLDAIKLLLVLGAQINGSFKSLSGQTALLFAVQGSQVDGVKLFLDREAIVDKLAISVANDPIISALLDDNRPKG